MTQLHQPVLTICRGLPGSGKTYWAKRQVNAADPDGSVIRVNRDDLRVMALHSTYREPVAALEALITKMQHAAIGCALHAGKDVISDDTNLRSKYVRVLMEIALANGARWEIKDFTLVDLETCLVLDAAREGRARVGAEVIRRMHRQYLAQHKAGHPLPVPELTATALDPHAGAKPYVAPEGKPMAFLVDLDGTLALMHGRSPYDETCVIDDLPNWPVITTVLGLVESGWHPIFMSGRTEACREDTTRWILFHVFNVRPASWTVSPIDLHMRMVGDQRPDHVVKLELFDRHVRDQFNVRLSLDDRNSVVALWRRMGITCLQVADGNF